MDVTMVKKKKRKRKAHPSPRLLVKGDSNVAFPPAAAAERVGKVSPCFGM